MLISPMAPPGWGFVTFYRAGEQPALRRCTKRARTSSPAESAPAPTVHSPLDGDHAEPARTLDVLIKNNFEKGRAAAPLHVHRSTLRDRIARISELTGVDLEGAEARGWHGYPG
ncbi:MAG TPA: helix-turn-helix domain-containing protein [Solirubrobacteraceae bacterium]|nr:helix-turn-helix domain-containing protein [Solirubrobacteraceae bacterium]